MQKIELTDHSDLNIHCPFCGAKVLDKDGLIKCKHVLYHASDYGFEYVSERLEFNADVEIDEKSIDEYTDEIEFPDSLKIAIYQPAPSFHGGYVAFSAK